MNERIKKALQNPLFFVWYVIFRFIVLLGKFLDDESFLKLLFFHHLGYWPNLKHPQSFNEKLQWLKLHDYKPEYTTMVDKILVKDYVASKIGEEYIIPTLAVYDKLEDVDLEKLPNEFVLKCNHDSGGICICSDKSKLNKKRMYQRLNRALKRDYAAYNREMPYKFVERKILAEKYIDDLAGDIKDYKVHCFNGEPQFILVCSDRFSKSGLKEDFYDTDWNKLPFKRPEYEHSAQGTEKPLVLDQLLELSRKLSRGIPFLRTDFYIINDKILFGELTFFPSSGLGKFEPKEADYTIGEMLKLPCDVG